MLIADAVNKKVAQINESQVQTVKNALKVGAEVLSFGLHFDGSTAWILTVTKPEQWQSELYRNTKTLKCVISNDKVEATLQWVKKKFPDAKTSK